ncbi:proline-rich protein 2-like [Oreochromis niloticus]|uniref:proline-rich protein 2-like n=1 Tax=Oreochromis niloticus TaxID=8128 RepID=UPI00090516E5|nr:proline-rich protein 2-like [Oreochromis niloticus]
MDPAAFTPPTELRKLITDSASKLINLWLEHEGEAFLYILEARLQQLISDYPWLLDSLHLLVQNFILHELHLQPSAATARPLASMKDVPSEPPDEVLPGPSEPTPRRKRRSRHRRGTPQPDFRMSKQPAVFSQPPRCPQFSQPPRCPQFSQPPRCPQFSQPPRCPQFSQPPRCPQFSQPPRCPQFSQPPRCPQFSRLRASPEAGCQSPANSGPLEVKTPAPAASLENFTEQSQPSSPAESSSEPSQHHASSAGGPESPIQPQAKLAGGSEEPVQPHVTSAGGPESPVQLQAKAVGGSEEPTQHHASSAGGPGGPSQHILMSAGGPGKPVQPSPAESSPATSRPSPAASPPAASPPAASASPPSGPASSDSSLKHFRFCCLSVP